jgi:hypothetical protein
MVPLHCVIPGEQKEPPLPPDPPELELAAVEEEELLLFEPPEPPSPPAPELLA